MFEKEKKISPGFTLVELLVVMAIIAILGTIIFVSIGNQRQKARIAAATSSVKSVMSVTVACVSFDGTVEAPVEMGGNPVCAGSSEAPEGIKWPALSNKCKYCGMSDDKTLVRFTCSENCIVTNDSNCNINNGKCEQKN